MQTWTATPSSPFSLHRRTPTAREMLGKKREGKNREYRKGKIERITQAELRLRKRKDSLRGRYMEGLCTVERLLQCVGFVLVYQIDCVCLMEPLSRWGNPSCSFNSTDLRQKQY